MIDHVKLSKLEGTYIKLLNKIGKTDLLILDDFGLTAFDDPARNAPMDIVELKYDKTSIIIAAQIPVKNWHETIGKGTIADAILDRMVHFSHKTGESMRKNKVKKKLRLINKFGHEIIPFFVAQHHRNKWHNITEISNHRADRILVKGECHKTECSLSVKQSNGVRFLTEHEVWLVKGIEEKSHP